MTRHEITGKRSLEFSRWIRENLPNSHTGFLVYNIDYVLFDKRYKKVMFLEEKTHGARVRFPQSEVIRYIDTWMRRGVGDGWKYIGYFTVVFENESPSDGRIWLDGEEITEDVLRDILSMRRYP